MRPRRITVLGTGAHHAIAPGARVAILAARARQLELRAVPGTAFTAAFSRSLDDPAGRTTAHPAGDAAGDAAGDTARLAALAAGAMRQAQAGRPRGPVTLICAAPRHAEPVLLERIAERAGVALASGSRLVRGGPSAFADALLDARSLLLDGAEEVMVGAVDSPLCGGRLEALARAGALHVDGANGRVLAEAGAFVRLALRRDAHDRARLAEVERGRQESAGDGALGRVLRRVVGAIARGPHRLLVDVTSDPVRTEAWLGDREALREGMRGGGADFAPGGVEVWSDDAGDVDGASGAWLSVVAIETARMGAIAGGGASIGVRDDDGEVAAITWDLPHPGGDFVASTTGPLVRVAPARARDDARWPAQDRDRLVRSLLEDIGSLGLLLAPGEAGPDRAATAARLCQCLDALAAIAIPGRGAPGHPDLLAAVRAYGDELSPPDRARRFARRFVEAHLVASDATPGAVSARR